MSAIPRDSNPALRKEVREWLAKHFVSSLRGKTGWSFHEDQQEDPGEDVKTWTRVMGEKGWGTPTWPREYGGGGLSVSDAQILKEEMQRIGAWDPIEGMGKSLFGPTLLEYGTEEQKNKYLPPIARQEVTWCQGFSEPGAGSDLASLQTKAEDKGDHFLVNGQKVWTSGAQHADMCFCLVRTDTTRKQGGISFIVIDMEDPGVETRPIKLIAGESPFCETFFTDVQVPKDNLVGPLNGGWTVAKRLLQYERSGDSSAALGGGVFGVVGSASELAKEYVGTDESGQITDPDLRTRIVRHEMEHHAFQLTLRRAMTESQANGGPSATTSILKNTGTLIGQMRAELMIEVMGFQGLGWEGDSFSSIERERVRGWLAGKATTIFGGTVEVQNNIIAKRILGLPSQKAG
jgi:alkylation response protein AidB-like acyl-CoA dehydrogenase